MSLLAVTAKFTFVDDKNKRSSTIVRLPTGFTIPEYIDACQQLATVIVQATKARLESVGFCIGLNVNEDATTTPDPTSDAQEKALLIASDANGLHTRMYFPTLDETVVLGGTDDIDTGNAAVSALLDQLQNGITLPDTSVFNVQTNRGGDVVTVDEFHEHFLRNRRRSR